jgi:hypothetical protein
MKKLNAYFFYSNNKGLGRIANQLKNMNCQKVLLAGKMKGVNRLLHMVNRDSDSTPNLFYRLDMENSEVIFLDINEFIHRPDVTYTTKEILSKYDEKRTIGKADFCLIGVDPENYMLFIP